MIYLKTIYIYIVQVKLNNSMQKITYICDTHKEYPKRLNPNKYFYTEYKELRPFYFHKILTKMPTPDWSETLVPTISDFKDKISYITNDYILNSIFFEYCDYYIDRNENENENENGNINDDFISLMEYGNTDEDGNVHEIESISDNYVSAMLPCNPFGPTGIGGRGLLGKWGPNHAADPIVITYDSFRNVYQLLVIERTDTPGIWALPGGMQDTNECISRTVTRELKEETNLILDIEYAQFIYSGYVNDPRNTDHAWMETSVYLFNINKEQRQLLLKTIKAGDDATKVKLIDINEHNKEYTNLYANHKEFVEYALKIINK